jgi:hypothetical protein
MGILVTSGHNVYEEFTIQAFSDYFMNTLQPAEDGKTKTHEGRIKPNLLMHLWCCCSRYYPKQAEFIIIPQTRSLRRELNSKLKQGTGHNPLNVNRKSNKAFTI